MNTRDSISAPGGGGGQGAGELLARVRRIKLVVLDVDGVLTDGGLYLDDDGRQIKRFQVRDGLGIRLLRENGIEVGLITARRSRLVELRGGELQVAFVHQGIRDKWACLARELAQRGLGAGECAYMGDDLVDLAVLARVGLACAPADAHAEVRQRVHWIAPQGGGQGAVRALADLLLQVQGCWERVVASMLGEFQEERGVAGGHG